MDNYLRISGYVRTSMVINIFCNLATLGMLTLFLLVFELGVIGSALATSISMCICSFIAMMPFVFRKTLLKFTKPKFSLSMVKEIVSCGSPVFLSNLSGRIMSILMNVSLMTLGVQAWGEGGGTTAVAVYAVLMYASDFCWPLLYGIGDSLAPAIGYNWGAGSYDRVKRIVKCAYMGTATVGILSAFLLFFLSGNVASLFANAEDVMLLEESTKAIKIFSITYLFRWFVLTTQSFLSAIEKPVKATLVSTATAFVFPVILLGACWNFGLNGVWANFAGVNLLAAILAIALFTRVMKEIKIKEKSAAESHVEKQ